MKYYFKPPTSVTCPGVSLGCDPELFLAKDGEVIGAEKVIPEAISSSYDGGVNKIILDGVQIELNPAPSTCRQGLAAEIAQLFYTLNQQLLKQPGVSADFTQTIELSKAEHASLSERARILGCSPSANAYDKGATISVDASTYRKRSAGGHIHLGFPQNLLKQSQGWADHLARVMDIMVGNTCVLLDRDPGAAERRKVYGRAGEYRTPNHGFEYRVLSNFWLRSYPLMGLVMGLARQAYSVAYYTAPATIVPSSQAVHYGDRWMPTLEETALGSIDPEKVREAINSNDLTLAEENFQTVKGFMRDYFADYSGLFGSNLAAFDYFRSKPMTEWFPQDPLTHWCEKAQGYHAEGWERFAMSTVAPQMLAAAQKAA